VNQGKTVFAQIFDFLPKQEFRRCVEHLREKPSRHLLLQLRNGVKFMPIKDMITACSLFVFHNKSGPMAN